MEVISTTNVDEIIKPGLKGIEAFAAFSKNPSWSKRKLNSVYKEVDSVIDSISGHWSAELRAFVPSWQKVKQTLDDMCSNYADRAEATRRWAQECFAQMREEAPVMTGKLKSSIRIIGTSVLDIDVKIDEDLMTQKTTMKNIVPYVKSYDKWLDGEEELKPIGSMEFTRDDDYSDYANTKARPKEWWKGGVEPLVYFKSLVWEFDIKKELAEKFGLVNIVEG